MTLSQNKINKVEQIFFNKEINQLTNRRGPISDNATISDIKINSSYDEKQNAWFSWIDMEISTQNPRATEYATEFNLPTGAWISDYYLYLGNEKEMGILAEKKSALWVYMQITNRRKDPGLLHYLNANKISFRVFPVTKAEPRKTGIQIIHKEAITMNIGGHELVLGTPKTDSGYEDDKVAYLTASDKSQLETVIRKPYFHFLLDGSSGSENQIQSNIQNIKQVLQSYPELSENSKFTFLNYNSKSLSENWESLYHDESFKGGYFLSRGIEEILIESCDANEDQYPITVSYTHLTLPTICSV